MVARQKLSMESSAMINQPEFWWGYWAGVNTLPPDPIYYRSIPYARGYDWGLNRLSPELLRNSNGK